MSIMRAIVCVILPPLAVIDKGWGNVIIVAVLTFLGWVPGIIGAMLICSMQERNGGGRC